MTDITTTTGPLGGLGGSGDHDRAYVFGEHSWLMLLRTRDQARLMVMRSYVQETRDGFGARYAGDESIGPNLEDFLREFHADHPSLAA